MKGHLEKRYKSSWTIVIERDKYGPGRRRITKNVRGTKKQAERIMYEMMAQIQSDTYIEPCKMSLGEYLEEWFKSHGPNLAPSTHDSYRMILDRHLIPNLGEIPLSQLEPMQIQAYYGKALEKLSARTVRYHHTVLRQALKQAVKWRRIVSNPADATTPPRARRPQVRALSPNEVGRLLKTAKNTPYYALIYTALFTGLRRGELLALKWSNVDLSKRAITVRESVIRLQGEFVFRQTKTEKGRRQVLLPQRLIPILKNQRKEYLRRRLNIGQPYRDKNLVFCGKYGDPLDPTEVSHQFASIAKKAGFEGLRFHDLRHTHATLLLSQGCHPKVVQERLGHENITTTLDTYSHVLPTMQEAAADGLDRLPFTGNDWATVDDSEPSGKPPASSQNP
jgi:integrase